ncbi:nuclear transport factor 2 family protein [Polaromonas sp. UC242_47]|uniref:nuclear transport factor 2 family protein n=1 Tax=Polaromonas sp. UC242_47 TaxID=3374626 RepID=UPI0037B23898
MNTVNLRVLALFSACLLAAPLALGQGGDVEQQISALSDEMIQANLKDDIRFYEKYYADDATIVHGNGKLFTKDQELADLKSGALKYESIDVRERKIQVYGDTAVVNFLLTFKGSLSGQPFSPTDLRRTVVWVKQKGNWKVVAWQVTRAPESK